jgi:hypothetical protein
MRKIAAMLFVCVYFIAVIKPYLPLLSYSFNKKDIAARYCVNKDKPQMHCEGKCHLAKELKKASKEDVKLPQIFKTTTEQISRPFQQTGFLNPVTSLIHVQISTYLESKGYHYSATIFEPPRFT